MGSYIKTLEPFNDPQFVAPAVAGTTLDADRNGTPINVKYLQRLALQLAWLAGVTGSFALEASLDYNPTLNTGSWFILQIGPGVNNGAGSALINAIDVSGVPWVRVKWSLATVNTAGTSAAVAWVAGKGF